MVDRKVASSDALSNTLIQKVAICLLEMNSGRQKPRFGTGSCSYEDDPSSVVSFELYEQREQCSVVSVTGRS